MVRFLENERPSLEGKTIAEQYPDEQAEESSFNWKEAAGESVREAKALAPIRPGNRYLLEVTGAAPQSGESSPEDHGFSFGAFWEWLHPERVRIEFWTWTLEDIESERPGRSLARAFLAFGESARIRVDVQAGIIDDR
jgi:hypothetical protein